jgi:hypothetical protein
MNKRVGYNMNENPKEREFWKYEIGENKLKWIIK